MSKRWPQFKVSWPTKWFVLGKEYFAPLTKDMLFRWFIVSEQISVQSRYHRNSLKSKFFPLCLKNVLRIQKNRFLIIISTLEIPATQFYACMTLVKKNGPPVIILPKLYCHGPLTGWRAMRDGVRRGSGEEGEVIDSKNN